jgi:hypothetical protein
VLPLRTTPRPSALVWQDGLLYYSDPFGDPRGILALPDTGGTATQVVDDGGIGLWVESDRVLFARDDQLYAAPIAGGPSELLADGHTFGPDAKTYHSVYTEVLDDSDLYWEANEYIEEPQSKISEIWNVWRMPRTGGEPEKLGTIPHEVNFPLTMIALADQLLVAESERRAYTLPKSGGPLLELPSVEGSTFLGMGPRGVLWHVEKRSSDGVVESDEVVLSKPTGGKPVQLWKQMPAGVLPGAAWPAPDGGWVVTAQEEFSDGKRHMSAWSLDTDGNGTRLGCDPVEDDWADALIGSSAALSDDAAYIIVTYDHHGPDAGSTFGWKIVRVQR